MPCRPLEGIKVGDIGPKFGFGGVDNGFLSMERVRIRECRIEDPRSSATGNHLLFLSSASKGGLAQGFLLNHQNVNRMTSPC